MRSGLPALLEAARQSRCAIAAFNVYTIDQAAGVVDAAVQRHAPVILQVHPSGRGTLLVPLIRALRAIADAAPVSVTVHLDHTSDAGLWAAAVSAGIDSVMADGSASDFDSNVMIVREALALVGPAGVAVEAELGRLAGSEDGSSATERDALLTDPDEVASFTERTGIAALAVCVGNVHGPTTRPLHIDLDRLADIATRSRVPLVLHGASGLPRAALARSIELGVCKVNVNTELRAAYLAGLRSSASPELAEVLEAGRGAAANVAAEVIDAVGSAGLQTHLDERGTRAT